MQNTSKQSKTEIFFRKLSGICYIFGAPDYWQEDDYKPTIRDKLHDHFVKFVDVIICILIFMEWGAYFTQSNLSDKQRNDLYMFSIGHPFMQAFGLSFHYYKDKVRHVIKNVANLTRVYNNAEVENNMIKTCKVYNIAASFLFLMVILSYGIDGLVQSILNGVSFITVVTAWPNSEDTSFLAGLGRLTAFIIWCLLNFRFLSVLYLVVALTVCLSHHFRNLKVYFNSLNDIFDEMISQKEKDEKYEKAFLVGVNMHVEILEYKKRCEEVCRVVYGSEILLNITAVITLLLQSASSERTLLTTISTLSAVMCVNLATGCFMWNAGDVTIESSRLSTAIFESGWQHCSQEVVVRMKPLLVFCMMMSQRPVLLKCLGVVKVSYESHLTIVKTSYSVFSVLY